MFQLSEQEVTGLVSQNVIPSRRSLGGSLSYAFTQEGVAMLSSVLRSKQAVRVNIEIMRAFVRLRELISTHVDLARRIEELERKYEHHEAKFEMVVEAIREMMAPSPSKKKGRLGFGH